MVESVHTERYQLFREILVEARTRQGLSQAALAGKLGRLQTFVSKYERGERRLDVVEFLDVAAACRQRPENVALAGEWWLADRRF
jgi:transcriptional regulator with XRE-family HTH domain